MSPKSAASGWIGAPPVTRDGFAFSNGIFFADASGQNRHPRASITELQAHFNAGNANDHPAHWFEAQLIHYDLKPSKTKATARMRLLDAVNSGTLTVPIRLARLENELKMEWTKKDREAKKEAEAVTAALGQRYPASQGKRKATELVMAFDASESASKKVKPILAPSHGFYDNQDDEYHYDSICDYDCGNSYSDHYDNGCDPEHFHDYEDLKEYKDFRDCEDLNDYEVLNDYEIISGYEDLEDYEDLKDHEDLKHYDHGDQYNNGCNNEDENSRDHGNVKLERT